MLRTWHRRWWMLLPIAAVGLLIGWQTGFFESRVADLDWEGEPVKFRVLALNHQGGFAVVNLEEGVMRLERLEHRGLPVGSVDVAAFTRSGDVLVHPSGAQELYVVPGGDFSAAPATIRLPRSVETEADRFDDVDADAVQALGDRSGENIWLLKRTDVATLVELITREGTVLAEFELTGSYYAAGLSDDDLVVTDDDQEDLVLRRTGAIDGVTTCRDDIETGNLRVVSVYGHRTACLSDDDKHLVLYDVTTGQTDRFTAFESGHWSQSVLPDIPAANTTGVHTDQLLLAYNAPDPTNPPYTVMKAIYAADLSNHTMRLLYDNEEGEFLTPLGVVDNLLIVATRIIGQGEVIMVIDTGSGERQTVVEMPEGYFIYDAA